MVDTQTLTQALPALRLAAEGGDVEAQYRLGALYDDGDGVVADVAAALPWYRRGGAPRIDTAYEVYLGLYQAITGPEEHQKIYREFSPGFFDLIVIDECHRGSAAEDSAWREILEYFSSATQIGLTATPKETKYVSNAAYFGEPVFSYSLKQGIRDGFLAPYKVVKVHIDRDVEGYRPEKGQLDRDGEEVKDRIYNVKDFDRTLVIDGRTKRVAHALSRCSMSRRRRHPANQKTTLSQRAAQERTTVGELIEHSRAGAWDIWGIGHRL